MINGEVGGWNDPNIVCALVPLVKCKIFSHYITLSVTIYHASEAGKGYHSDQKLAALLLHSQHDRTFRSRRTCGPGTLSLATAGRRLPLSAHGSIYTPPSQSPLVQTRQVCTAGRA